eukprot:s5_g5.t1
MSTQGTDEEGIEVPITGQRGTMQKLAKKAVARIVEVTYFSSMWFGQCLKALLPLPVVQMQGSEIGVAARLARYQGNCIPPKNPEVQVLHESPSAEAFFTRYVLTGTPVVIRGAFLPEHFQPAASLPDFTFLRRKCAGEKPGISGWSWPPAIHDRPSPVLSIENAIELKLPFSAYLDAVEACERGERPMPYYLGKAVGLRNTLGMTLLAWHSCEDTLEKTLLA